MKKRLRRIALILSGIMLMTALSACGSSTGTTQAPAAEKPAEEKPAEQTEPAVSEAPAAEERSGADAVYDESIFKKPEGEFVCTPEFVGWENAEIEITWQPAPSHSMDSGSEAKSSYIAKRATEWVQAHPNVKVRVVGTTNNINDNMAKLRLEVVEGTQADVVAIDSFMVNIFRDYATPIDEDLERNGISVDDYFPFIQDTMKNDAGETICFQYTTDVRALFYRKDWIETPPATIAELMEVSQRMKDEGHDAMITAAGKNESVVNNHLGLFWSQGGRLIDDEGNLGFAEGESREAMLNYLKYFEDMAKAGYLPSRVVNYSSDKDTYAELAAGNVAMAVGASSVVAQMQEIIGAEAFDAQWGVAPLPVFNDGDQTTSSAGGWTYMVFTDDDLKHKLAADLALYIYGTDDGMIGWCTAGGYFPTQERIFREFDPFMSDPYAQIFADYLETASKRPSNELYTSISSELQTAIGNIVTGTSTAEDALDTVIANIQNQ